MRPFDVERFKSIDHENENRRGDAMHRPFHDVLF
jgi:hypothetical protein